MKKLLLMMLPVALLGQGRPARVPAAPAFEFTSTNNASQAGVSLLAGYQFSVKTPVVLTSLGAVLQGTSQPVFGALPQQMLVSLWDDAQNLLVSETVSTADPMTGHFNYHAVRELALRPGVNYTIAGLIPAGLSVLSDVPDATPGAEIVYGGPRSLVSKTVAFPSGDEIARANYFGASFTYSGGAAPVAIPGRDRTVRPGTAVKLDGGESFTERGGTVEQVWKLVSAPEGSTAELKGDSSAPWLAPDREGVYVVQLSVHDGDRHSVPSTVSITAASPAGSDR